ncbi:MAG TPA: tripartite tricarboxylate transporter substrate binding protein [Burkholderiales bacterium]|nr:tripartite tricarboxylate transporter substrate binding protein [Burkholderiales bacterium]
MRKIAFLLSLLVAFAAGAQSYPAKPVRVVVTFPPGGTPDIYGRVMAAELQKAWGQGVLVENRTGAGGTIGTDAVAKAAPDGYTLLFAADATITIAPSLYAKLPYDPVRDFAPIINVARGPFVLLAHPSLPANTLPELIALAKAQPGKLSYASSGAGGQQHLAMETVKNAAGIDVLHIPYKGFGQGLADVMAGQVPMIFGGITASLQIAKSGKLKPIAVTSPARAKAMPQVAAIAETLPGFDIQAWYGFVAPAGTPREIVRKVHDDAHAIIQRPDFQKRLAGDAIEPVANSPEEFGAQIRADVERWRRVVAAAGVKAE